MSFNLSPYRSRFEPLSRWALIFVVEARQRAKGFYAEGKRILVN
jgi:hypothetical protein